MNGNTCPAFLVAALLGAALLTPASGDPSPAPPNPVTATPDLAAVAIPPLLKARTVQVSETWTRYDPASPAGAAGQNITLSVRVAWPGKIRIDKTAGAAAATAAASILIDGTTEYEYTAASRLYRKSPAPSLARATLPSDLRFAQAAPLSLLRGRTLPVYTLVGTDASQAHALHVYECSYHKNGRPALKRLWVDAQTHLPTRMDEYETRDGTSVLTTRTDFSDWHLDAALPPDAFAWAPPDGAREYVPTAQRRSPFLAAVGSDAHPPLLAEGTPAPDFTVQDAAGRPVRLSQFRGQAVVLDFWATWCGPCQLSLPDTGILAREYQGKGAVVLAVNVWDTPEAFEAWLPQHPEDAAIDFVIDPSPKPNGVAERLYRVWGIPTQYVIDPGGRIVVGHVGYDGAGEKSANEALLDEALWKAAKNE